MQSIVNVSRSARTFLLAALTLSASLTVFAATASAAPVDNGQPCTIVGTPGDDVLIGTSKNDVICGLDGGDILRGLGGNDLLRAGPGWDELYGGGGRDLLSGGDGPDLLRGGTGADVFSGGEAGRDDVDRVAYWGYRVGVTVTIGDGPNDGAAGEGDDVQGDVENLSGGKGDDTLIGNDASNDIRANGGNDRLVGGLGRDWLISGDGDDSIDSVDDRDDAIHCGNGIDSLLHDSFDWLPGSRCEIFL